MGLLDNMNAPQPTQGGLLATPTEQTPQGNDAGKQLATMLMQSPTPETVQMVVGKLMQKGTPEAQQMAEVLTQIQSNPEGLTKIAQAIMQNLQGSQQ
jgi:hypothetical protein